MCGKSEGVYCVEVVHVEEIESRGELLTPFGSRRVTYPSSSLPTLFFHICDIQAWKEAVHYPQYCWVVKYSVPRGVLFPSAKTI